MVYAAHLAVAFAVAQMLVDPAAAKSQAKKVDCKMSEWSAFGECTAGGLKTHTRSVEIMPSGTGALCGGLSETLPCEDWECWMGPWGPWTCDSDTGKKTRTRLVVNSDKNPAACPPQSQADACDPIACVLNTVAEDKANAYGTCYQNNAGSWIKTKQLGVKVPAQYGGKPCGDATTIASCPAVDCKWSTTEFDDWTLCDTANMKYHPYKILQKAKYSGLACPSIEQRAVSASCLVPRDCVPTVWKSWSDCAPRVASPTIWEKTRTRNVSTPAANGGKSCDPLIQTDGAPCKNVDCIMSDWTSFGTCALTSTPKVWQQIRTRTITTQQKYGGNACVGDLTDTRTCANVDCVLEDWTDWGACAPSATPGVWTSIRTRSIKTQPAYSGAACDALKETRTCANVNCAVSGWTGWGTCGPSSSPGVWTRTRTRTITTQPANAGTKCNDLQDTETCPNVNCALSVWTPWSTCAPSASPGVWTSTRSRTIITQPANAGSPCDILNDTRECPNVDCALSQWGSYSTCAESSTPGVWTKTRTRTITTQPANAGSPCDVLVDTPTCPNVNCVLSAWTSFGACAPTSTANVWKKTRTRTITTPFANGGTQCDALEDTQTCQNVNCQVGEWTAWDACQPTSTPTVWTSMRTRVITTQPVNGGTQCEPLQETQTCQNVNCAMSAWTAWSTCAPSSTPSVWTSIRTRTIRTQPANGGTQCEPVQETQTCPNVNCAVSDWTAWDACMPSSTPSVWTHTRTRSVTTQPANAGTQCDVLTETETCPNVNCVLSGWGQWGACGPSATPGVWTSKRTRTATTAAANAGTACDTLEDSQVCPNVNCVVTSWGAFGGCAETATPGVWAKIRTKNVTTPSANAGTACPPLSETQACVAVNCLLSSWTSGVCTESSTPGVWTKPRTRTVVKPAIYGGTACPALSDTQVCPSQNCVMGDWTQPSTCAESAATPGLWQTTRTRPITKVDLYGGRPCGPTIEIKDCVKVDCLLSSFGDWNDCAPTATPGVWNSTRTRAVISPAANGGTPCQPLTESQTCANVDCEMTPWSEWDECAESAPGVWESSRARSVITDAENGGATCPATLQETQTCPNVDCVVSAWSDWDPCAETSTPGLWQSSRTRTVTTEQANGGRDCDSLADIKTCPRVDCAVGNWTPWSPCSESSTPGVWTSTRTGRVTATAANGGADCGPLGETQTCQNVDCVLSDWSAWSVCSAGSTPGVGTQIKTRNILQPAANGGRPCDAHQQTQSCSVDCEVSGWSAWGSCAQQGGASGYIKAQTRTITRQPGPGGAPCPALMQTTTCTVCELNANLGDAASCNAVLGSLTDVQFGRVYNGYILRNENGLSFARCAETCRTSPNGCLAFYLENDVCSHVAYWDRSNAARVSPSAVMATFQYPASTFTTNHVLVNDNRMVGPGLYTQFVVPTHIQCAAMCAQDPRCRVFNFRYGGVCEFLSGQDWGNLVAFPGSYIGVM